MKTGLMIQSLPMQVSVYVEVKQVDEFFHARCSLGTVRTVGVQSRSQDKAVAYALQEMAEELLK